MNVNIKPIDFQWPGQENSEPMSLELEGSMILQEILNYLAEQMGIPNNLIVAQDQYGSTIFSNNQSLNQLSVKPNQEIYLFMRHPQAQSQNVDSQLAFYIDDIQQPTSFQISPDSTGQDILTFLVENQLFDGQCGSVIIRSEQGNQTSNLNEPFSNLGISGIYSLYIYTQVQNPAHPKVQVYVNEQIQKDLTLECPYDCKIADIIQNLIQSNLIKANYSRIVVKNSNGFEQTENIHSMIGSIGRFPSYDLHIYNGPANNSVPSGPVNKGPSNPVNNQQQNTTSTFTPDVLAKSLVVLENVSLFIDPNNEFIVYRYHQPADIRGILRANKGRELKNLPQGLDFQPICGIQLAENDDYGFVIKWKNNKFSKVKINLRQ